MYTLNYSSIKIPIFSVLNIVITVLISAVFIFYSNFITQNFFTIGYTSLILYLMFFITWFNQCKDKINYYTIFLLFTYIFYFGQFLLLIIGAEFQYGSTILSGLLSEEDLFRTGVFIQNYMTILHLGVLISTTRINYYCNMEKLSKRKDLFSQKSEAAFKKVAITLFLISIVPTFMILINNIQITFTSGYGAIFQSESYTSGGFDNIERFFSQFIIPSFLMLLIAFKNNKKLKIINLFLFMYLALYFLSGSRLNGILVLAALVLIQHNWYKPYSKQTILKISAYITAIILLVTIISASRNAIATTDDPISLLTNIIENLFINNPLILALQEAGYTFLAITTVLTNCPSLVSYNFGQSYLDGFLMLFPNLFWDVHPAANTNTDIVFKGFLTKYGGMGSSFIAEAYFNFGMFSLLLAPLFGILIGILTKKIIKHSKEQNIIKFYLFIYIAQFSLFYVRSDTVSFWRNFIYYGIIPIFITVLLTKKRHAQR